MRQRRHLTIAIVAAVLLLGGAAWLRIPSPRGPSYTPVDIRDLSAADIDPADEALADVPSYVRGLNGRKVVIEAEPYRIVPENPRDGDDLHFRLAYSLNSWGSPVAGQKYVSAHMPSAQLPSDFRRTYVDAYGTLHVTPVTDPITGVTALGYSLDVDRLENTDGSGSGAGSILSVWPLLSAWSKGMILTVLLALVAWVVGVLWYRQQRAALRDPAAIPCPICGYDARGNTRSRCPECNALLSRP